jgi:hypothetical protein
MWQLAWQLLAAWQADAQPWDADQRRMLAVLPYSRVQQPADHGRLGQASAHALRWID